MVRAAGVLVVALGVECSCNRLADKRLKLICVLVLRGSREVGSWVDATMGRIKWYVSKTRRMIR
jgi:hypothetical protein